MTKTENLKCHFCQATATHLKRDAVLEERNDENGQCLPDAIVTEELPICLACEDENYDGTEIYPGVTPLA